MATSKDVAILEVDNSGVKTYSRTFRVPPASILFNNTSVINKHGYKFCNHSWEFKILPSRVLEIQFRMKYYPDKGYKLHLSKALLLAGDNFKAEVNLDFRAVEVGNWIVWRCTTKEEVEYIRKWDDSVDSIRVEVQFQCDSSGKCLNSQGCNPRAGLGAGNNLKSKDFFLNDFLSDVSLVCESERFPAHRLILSCQSSVFQRMFQTEMKERTEGVVEIADVDSKVLKEVLHFMYKDELSTTEIGDDLSLQLYNVAHKYEIQVLKLKCQNQIMGSIRPENAIEILVVADLYNDERVKQKALEVIKREKKKVMKDVTTLLEFTKNYPHLAFDLFNL